MGNENKKAVIWMRGSTDFQEIDTQKKELTKIATEKEGFKKQNLIYIGKAGASAIKQNELYQKEVKELITTLSNDNEVKTVFVWEISRLARNELAFYQMKDFFVKNHIQLICQTPTLKLYDEDGKINQGTELTLALLITLAKQEMEIKKERFKRGKNNLKKQGKFVGGSSIKYGYMLDSNRYFIPCPEEVEQINLMFNLYSTGKYSMVSLYKELSQRGMKVRNKPITVKKIENTLKDRAYINDVEGKKYPQIISNEIWNKCISIRKDNNLVPKLTTKETVHCNLGIRHLKCSNCGGYMIATSNDLYSCYHHNKVYTAIPCSHSDTIKRSVFDRLIWDVAMIEHIDYLEGVNKESLSEYEDKLNINNQKLEELSNKLNSLSKRKDRVMDLYMSGDITKQRYEQQKIKIEVDKHQYQSELNVIKKESNDLETIIDQIINPSPEQYVDLAFAIIDENNAKKRKEIVDKYIGDCFTKRIKYKNRSCCEIIINTLKGISHKFIFFPYSKGIIIKWNHAHEQYERYDLLNETEKHELYNNDLSTRDRKLYKKINQALSSPDVSDNEKKILKGLLRTD